MFNWCERASFLPDLIAAAAAAAGVGVAAAAGAPRDVCEHKSRQKKKSFKATFCRLYQVLVQVESEESQRGWSMFDESLAASCGCSVHVFRGFAFCLWFCFLLLCFVGLRICGVRMTISEHKKREYL